ncbi:MAG TPA: N-6 DNA methylase [Pyrinomonadaceae bacterium]|nr:N-6 DNA methylase [Pyrinomonadaceae bacterium]
MKTSDSLTDRTKIAQALKAFDAGSLESNAIHLFDTLGYRSSKSLQLEPNTVAGLLQLANLSDFLNPSKAHAEDWRSVDFLFQITDEEVKNLGEGTRSFDSKAEPQSDKQIESYIFFAIELKKDYYPRGVLADITREINRIFPMPALVVFKHGNTLTLSIINRRIHKRDEARDVLEKVTLIKDIRSKDPHRAHVEILLDLSFPEIQNKYLLTNFVELHNAWQNTLSISHLNKAFYKRIVAWFNQAIEKIKLPGLSGQSEKHKDFAIRLIARLVFVWFLKELKVVDEGLLHPESRLLDHSKPDFDYYKFVLQNLFFNALNKERENRADFSNDFDLHGSYFVHAERLKALLSDCPFLNGGLFDEAEDDFVLRGGVNNAFKVPNDILLGEGGLNTILSQFKFTLTENTALDEEIAVEPEMLGRIFENLLAEQSDDTKEAARKNAGAFYTPRPIVSYMCKNVLLRHLDIEIKPENGKEIVKRLLKTTIVDPACGSGAFLIGMLEEMMSLLEVADPKGKIWFSEIMKSKDATFREYVADFIADDQLRFVQKLGLLRNCLFGIDLLDYAVEITKLRCWLSLIIEQKVDLAKKDANYNLKPLPNLEFKFYQKNSLLRKFKDREIQPLLEAFDKKGFLDELINLENKFFIAVSDKHGTKEQVKTKIINLLEGLVDEQIGQVEVAMKLDFKNLLRLRADKRTPAQQIKKADKAYQKSAGKVAELSKFRADIKLYFIERIVFPTVFNSKGENKGFDIVIGNPPYVNTKLISQMNLTDTLKSEYGFCDDLYNHFTIRGLELLKKGGLLSYITSDTFLTIQTKENMRRVFLGLHPKQARKGTQAHLFESETTQPSKTTRAFDHEAEHRLLEIINTPKAFAAMVDTAIFTLKKEGPTDSCEVSYVDIRFPKAETFGLTADEWKTVTQTTDNYASWEKILERVMIKIQLPINLSEVNQPKWKVSHTCNGTDVLSDTSTQIEKYRFPLAIYHQSLNFAIFAPNKSNARIFDMVIKPAFPVFEEWWSKIETSKQIEENRAEIRRYMKGLKAGDITLLGLITDGGVGLQTGDNGAFVGALAETRIAERIAQTRPQKLMEAVAEKPRIRKDFKLLSDCLDLADYQDAIGSLSELKTRELFDAIKERFGRRVFGKGYLYRIVNSSEVHNVAEMTRQEKLDGINSKREIFVPYDKGDKEGNRWYIETPYYLNWSKRAVSWFKDNSGKSGEGMPVVRNIQFYFKAGFCWSDVLNPSAEYIKCRKKDETVNDVLSMSLYDESGLGTEYFVSILNSYLSFKAVREMLNSSVHLQMNDLRKLPIKIPTSAQLANLNAKCHSCIAIKKRQFAEELTGSEATALLRPIEREIDQLVYRLYDLQPDIDEGRDTGKR